MRTSRDLLCFPFCFLLCRQGDTQTNTHTPGGSCVPPPPSPSAVLSSPRRVPLKWTAPSLCSLWWSSTLLSSPPASSSQIRTKTSKLLLNPAERPGPKLSLDLALSLSFCISSFSIFSPLVTVFMPCAGFHPLVLLLLLLLLVVVVVVLQTSDQLSSHYLKLRSIKVWRSDWLRVVLAGCDWSSCYDVTGLKVTGCFIVHGESQWFAVKGVKC